MKFFPIVLAALYWRRVRVRDGVLAGLAVAILYLPFLQRGSMPIGSLELMVRQFRFNDPIFAVLERLVNPFVATGLAVLVGLATGMCLRRRQHDGSLDSWAWPMAASLAFGPVVYPWYLLWLVPFLRPAQTLPLIVWTLTILSTYFVWHLHALGHPWQVPPWITALEYSPVLIAAAFAFLRRPAPRSMPVAEVN